MARLACGGVAIIALVSCAGERPWQPAYGLPEHTAPATEDALTELRALLPQEAGVAAELELIEHSADRWEIVLRSASQAATLRVVEACAKTWALREMHLLRAARYSPASWDTRLVVYPTGEVSGESRPLAHFASIQRALGSDVFAGKVWLDEVRITAGSLTLHLRTRAKLLTLDESRFAEAFGAESGGQELSFVRTTAEFRDRPFQSVYKFTCTCSPVNDNALLAAAPWVPEGGPSAEPYRDDNRVSERLDKRESGESSPGK